MRGDAMDWQRHLIMDPKVCAGAPTARGTRVLLRNILDSLAEGASVEEIMHSFPGLRREHVDAAFAYARDAATARR